MGKLQNFKQAIKNPPAVRLAKIEYRSHFLQALGVIAVSIILITKGFWYIIFALIFGVGVSYSQGMSAFAKYKAIKEIMPKEKMEDFDKDISFTRRRSKIVTYVFGGNIKLLVIFFSVGATVFLIPPTLSRWLLMLFYPLMIMSWYILLYLGLLYWAAYPVYLKVLKGGNGNGREERN